MKQYFQKYRPFLIFLAKFFGTYLFLIFIYASFLKHYDGQNRIDSATISVSKFVEKGLDLFDFESKMVINHPKKSVDIYKDNFIFIQIIEGCNAISVMILFVAFVIAFSNGFWHTFLYLIFGALLIYILNILRIILIIIGIYNFPELKELLHDIIFPLIIYGTVVLLWLFWINKFSDFT